MARRLLVVLGLTLALLVGGCTYAREEPGLFDATARDALALQRQLDLLGRTTEEVARLEARWALLDEAKKRGIPVSQALNAQIEAEAANIDWILLV